MDRSQQNRGGAPLRRPSSSILWNHPCLLCRMRTTAIQCLDPPRRLSFNGPFRCKCRRTLASALALAVIGPRSRGRRVQTLLSLLCSLDSPPRSATLSLMASDCYLVCSPFAQRLHVSFGVLRRRMLFAGGRYTPYVTSQEARELTTGVDAQELIALSAVGVDCPACHVERLANLV